MIKQLFISALLSGLMSQETAPLKIVFKDFDNPQINLEEGSFTLIDPDGNESLHTIKPEVFPEIELNTVYHIIAEKSFTQKVMVVK